MQPAADALGPYQPGASCFHSHRSSGPLASRFDRSERCGECQQRAWPAVWGLACAALFLFTLTAGCVRSQPRADLVIINGAEAGSLDPATVLGVEELRVVMALFEGLTRNDPVTGRPVPGLAERWDISPDGLRYVFHLREGLRWSTGEPISARDVVESWARVLDPATASEYVGQLFYVRNAEAFYNGTITNRAEVGFAAPDDRTVVVQLESPTPFFLDLCAFQTLAVVPTDAIAKHGDAWLRAAPVPFSGPYTIEFWRVNDRIRLRKNPHYWDAAQTHLETIDLLPIGTPSTAFNLYDAGAADIIWDKDLLPAELFSTLRQRPDFHTFTYLGTYFLRVNVTRRPFQDARVRQALALAIDKPKLIEKIFKTGEPVASHLVPPGTANYDPAEGLGYDPERARRLLAEAGYPGGKGFPSFQYLVDSSGGGAARLHGKVAVELQAIWKQELGVNMEPRQMEKKVYLRAQTALDYDVARSSWIGDYNDPNTFLDLFMSGNGNNRTGWSHARYDDLLRQAHREPDLVRRAALMKEAETILVRDEAPIIPICFYNGFFFYNPARWQGIYTNILDLHPLGAIQRVQGATGKPGG